MCERRDTWGDDSTLSHQFESETLSLQCHQMYIIKRQNGKLHPLAEVGQLQVSRLHLAAGEIEDSAVLQA